MTSALPGIKIQHHRACPCCGHAIAYVSVTGQGAWYHIGPREQVGQGRCGPLYPEQGPNGQLWIAKIIWDVRARRDAAGRRHERRARLHWYRDRPLVRHMRIPGLPLPRLVTVPADVYMDLQDEAMFLLRARHELELQVERLQERVDELQGHVAELVEQDSVSRSSHGGEPDRGRTSSPHGRSGAPIDDAATLPQEAR